MRGLPAIPTGDAIRTRRWDAVILGGALPGLISAVLLGMRGARVLVVEEEAALSGFAGLREPFLLTGAGSHSVLGACLREIGIPLIDQRRIATHPLAYQVALPDAEPYTPLFVVVSGHEADAPADGFGADYPGGMFVNHLLHVWPTGKCAGDWKP